MRYSFLVLLLIILASCSTARIKKVRVIVDEPNQVEQTTSQANFPEENNPKNEVITQDLTVNDIEIPQSILIDGTTDTKPLIDFEPAQQTTSNDDDDDEIVDQAYYAADQAKKARNLFITSASTLGASVIFPPAFLLTIVFLILGAISFARAKRSRYITSSGESYLQSAQIWLIVNVALISALLIFTGVILALFLL